MATASPLKEGSQNQLLRTNYYWRHFRCPFLVQCQYQCQFYSCICVFDLWGLTCLPVTPVRLTFLLIFGTKILYQVCLLRSRFSMYIFGRLAFCIFSVVVTMDPRWRILVLFCMFLITWSSSLAVRPYLESLPGSLHAVYFLVFASTNQLPVALSIFLIRWSSSRFVTTISYNSMFPSIFFTLSSNVLLYDWSFNASSNISTVIYVLDDHLKSYPSIDTLI